MRKSQNESSFILNDVVIFFLSLKVNSSLEKSQKRLNGIRVLEQSRGKIILIMASLLNFITLKVTLPYLTLPNLTLPNLT